MRAKSFVQDFFRQLNQIIRVRQSARRDIFKKFSCDFKKFIYDQKRVDDYFQSLFFELESLKENKYQSQALKQKEMHI